MGSSSLTLVALVILLGASVGLTVILVRSYIAKPLRTLLGPPIGTKGQDCCDEHPAGFVPRPTLLGCCLCTGVWTGLGWGAYGSWRGFLPWDLGIILGFALAASVASYVVGTWLCEHDRHR
jgi:hypothetical protein